MKDKTLFLTFCLLFLFVAYTQQLGVLYVNQIIGNTDYATVTIEQSVINDNLLQTTFINGLASCEVSARCGVFVEQVNYFVGNTYVPVNLEVYINSTIEGPFYPNGGIFSDAYPNGGYSFLVEDNTGDTSMIGVLRVYGGIDANDGVFTVAKGTGETEISTALLKPNGGINVQDGQFTVDPNGNFFTSNFANVEQNVIVGTSIAEDRYITRFPDSASVGGDTYITGQSVVATGAGNVGGDLILEPGVGQDHNIGSIIIGRVQNDDLYFGRPSVTSPGTYGGTTTFHGQDSYFGNGGSIVFRGGDSTTNGNGGDIVLSVGYSPSGTAGNIVLGNTNVPNYDLLAYRPSSGTSNGGSTYIFGQSTNDGNAGSLYLQAGSPTQPSGINPTPAGGNIHLSPGVSQTGQQGRIVLGRSTPTTLIVSRYPNLGSGNAGATYIEALDAAATAAPGGDLLLRAGNGGNNGDGGNIFLTTGQIPSNAQAGVILWGSVSQPLDLTVQRASSYGSGAVTAIMGQDSLSSNGGDVILTAGTSSGGSGGSLNLQAGSGVLSNGGNVEFFAEAGTQSGGSIVLQSGGSITAGGAILVTAGSASNVGGTGGSIYFSAGSGSALGNVVVESTSQVNIKNTNVILYDDLEISSSGVPLTFSANPDSILSYNGQTLIKDRIYGVQVVDNTPISYSIVTGVEQININLILRLYQIRDTVEDLLNALSQCGHGLLTTVDANNNPAYCNLPGPVPTPVPYVP